MELNEMIEIGILLDYYKPLLTEKQKKYLIEYFEQDLTLSEIAQNYEVSRQAVYDNIKRGCKILREYEDKLNFYKRDRKLYNQLIDLRNDFKRSKLDNIINSLS